MNQCTLSRTTGGTGGDKGDGGEQQQSLQQRSSRTASPAVFVTTVQASDVLMGRGQSVMVNKGNQSFIEIIRSRSAEYQSIKSRKQKHIIAQQIAITVRRKGGLFLRKIESPKEAKALGVPADVYCTMDTVSVWAIVDERGVLLKIKQALRDQGLVMDNKTQSSRCNEEESHHNKLTTTTQKRPKRKQTKMVAKAMSTNNVNDGS